MIGKPASLIIPLDRQGEEETILSRIAQGERDRALRRRKDGTLGSVNFDSAIIH
jgi:hypothetical protein